MEQSLSVSGEPVSGVPLSRIHASRLNQLRKEASECSTLYDKTQLDYSYMEYLLDHATEIEVSLFKEEIETFRLKCVEWIGTYEESIYPQFARLLDELHKII